MLPTVTSRSAAKTWLDLAAIWHERARPPRLGLLKHAQWPTARSRDRSTSKPITQHDDQYQSKLRRLALPSWLQRGAQVSVGPFDRLSRERSLSMPAVFRQREHASAQPRQGDRPARGLPAGQLVHCRGRLRQARRAARRRGGGAAGDRRLPSKWRSQRRVILVVAIGFIGVEAAIKDAAEQARPRPPFRSAHEELRDRGGDPNGPPPEPQKSSSLHARRTSFSKSPSG